MKRIVRKVRFVGEHRGTITIGLHCGHEITLQTDPLYAHDVAMIYLRKKHLGWRVHCKECQAEAEAEAQA